MTQVTVYRDDGLLAWRGCAALAVVLHHSDMGSLLARWTGVDALRVIALSGSYAVFMFFALSGYLMASVMSSKYRANVTGFYRSRAIRIVPVYYFAIAISVLLGGNIYSMMPSLLFMSDYFFIPTNNNPLWSISTEFKFYIMTPILFMVFRRNKYLIYVVFFAYLAARAFYLYLANQPGWTEPYYAYMGVEVNMMFFIAGWYAYSNLNIPRIKLMLAIAILSVVLLFCWWWHYSFISGDLYKSISWMIVLPGAISVMMLLLLPSLDSDLNSLNPGARFILAFLGRTSFAVYVIHVPIIHKFPDMNVLLRVFLTYIAAYLVHISIEAMSERVRGQ